MTRITSLIVVGLCLSGVFGFLPTRLNFDDPDLSDIFCDVDGITTDLKAITREGIRREIRNLFNEDPPPGSTGFFVPEDATLSEMFHMYYGEDASATRFYKAVNNIAWANANLDSMESTKYDTRYHFDGEQIEAGQELLATRHSIIVSSLISNQSYDFARQQIGYSLHAIQDFYSHSNWIELGNDNILSNLGLPGFNITSAAGVGDAVCSDCIAAEGSCVDNVLASGKLTSGYYEYDIAQASRFIVSKPDSAGKCSFGGSLDDSKTENAIGGINKASTSNCFSPHAYLHDTAVGLAEEATQNYLSIIRAAIGNEQFKLLFDLYSGSALVIVIDTTGSMGGEILAVQQEVAIIVDTAPADLYILVPYNDPGYGPVTRTTDSQEFLDAVNALAPYGGGDQPEMVWNGLQLALVNVPDYSNLYLFTDAGGKDYQLMNGDFAMAQDKNIICTTIFSYLSAALVGPPYTDDTDFMKLAAVTGGEFISIDDFTIDNVISIIDNGIDSSVVSLALRREVTGDISFNALVDDTVSALQITITGTTTTATIADPSGTVTDLKDFDTLNSTSNIVITAVSETLIDVTFISPEIGNWFIEVSSPDSFSVTADGASTLGYIVEFTELDIRPPRPNYKLIQGQPIQSYVYYVENTLVGWIDSEVSNVVSMDFLDRAGNVLSHVANTEPVDDEFYIQSNPLPNQAFYVSLEGFLNSGNGFVRLYETLITPSYVGVSVDLYTSVLAAPPDSTVLAYFQVQNYGNETTYNYYVADDKNYVNNFSPNSSTLDNGGMDNITVTLYVPADAEPWTESTIVVTASAADNENIVNSDVTYFIVLPLISDSTPPTCVKNDEPDCSEFASEATCDGGNWTVSATLQDTDSGLSTIYTQPSNNDTNLDDSLFVPGTTDNVDVAITASCCVTRLRIIGVDEQGNVGICDYDMGTVAGLLTFEAIDEGSTWIYLEWTVDSVSPDLYKYTLITDNGLSNDIQCFLTVCHYNSTNLTPCSSHHYELTPYFDYDSDVTTPLEPGVTDTTDADTLDSVPDPPINGVVSDGAESSEIVVSWDEPENGNCIVQYEVCYETAGTKYIDPASSCVTTSDTTVTITGLEACSLYGVNVTSVTVSGLTSTPLDVEGTTADDAPGAPTNFTVVTITAVSANVSWNPPLENPQCVQNYEVTWIEIEENGSPVLMKSKPIKPAEEIETDNYWSTVSPLTPCANYTFVVYAVSHGGLHGPDAVTYGETEETSPSEPQNLDLQATGTSSINATWNPGAGICTGFYDVCITDPYLEVTNCTDVIDPTYEFTNLVSCTPYTVSVTGESPGGLLSPRLLDVEATDDEAPGPPTNLTVVSTTSSSVTIEFGPPTVNPQCVHEYDISYIDMDANIPNQAKAFGKEKDAQNSNTLTGIEACTDVFIMVRSVSIQGLTSEFVNTTATTDEESPSAPNNVQVASITTDSISIRWFAPSTNARCADYYRVIWISSTGSSDFDTVDTLAKSQYEFEYTLTGLISCTDYTIMVSGYTPSGEQGQSASSNPSPVMTTC